MEIALAPALRTSPAIVSLLTRTTATETYTLSLHDALPISRQRARREPTPRAGPGAPAVCRRPRGADAAARAGAGRGRRGRDEARRDRRARGDEPARRATRRPERREFAEIGRAHV